MPAQDAQEERKATYRQACNRLARHYLVRDIVPDTATFVFLLESPHIQELKYGAPVSGSSGASMSRHLFGEAYGRLPLGVIVKKNRDEKLHRPSLDRVGLMNVCNIPMQSGAYKLAESADDGDPAVVREDAGILRILENLRTANGSRQYADASWSIVQEILVESLRRRLQQLWERRLHIVACGRFAQKFFALADTVSPHWKVVHGIPHPSYNNWSKPDYASAISHLLEAFRSE